MNKNKILSIISNFSKSISFIIISVFISRVLLGILDILCIIWMNLKPSYIPEEVPETWCIIMMVLFAGAAFILIKKLKVNFIIPAIIMIFMVVIIEDYTPYSIRPQYYFVDIGIKDTDQEEIQLKLDMAEEHGENLKDSNTYSRYYCFYNCDCVKETIANNPKNDNSNDFIGNYFYSNKEALIRGLTTYSEKNKCCDSKEGKLYKTFIGNVIFFPGLIFETFYYSLVSCLIPIILIAILITWILQILTRENNERHLLYRWIYLLELKKTLIVSITLLILMILFNTIYLLQIGEI